MISLFTRLVSAEPDSEKGKAFGNITAKGFLGRGRQPVSTHTVTVISPQQLLRFESTDNIQLITVAARESAELIGRKLAGYGNKFKQRVAHRLLIRQTRLCSA